MSNPTIQFDEQTLVEFKAARDAAVDAKQDKFKFHGAWVLVSYAKHLIEHVENELKRNPMRQAPEPNEGIEPPETDDYGYRQGED